MFFTIFSLIACAWAIYLALGMRHIGLIVISTILFLLNLAVFATECLG